MRIDGPGQSSKIGSAGKSKKARESSSTFSLSDTAEAAPRETGSLQASSSLTSVDALLALQAVEDPLTGHKKALQTGHDLLDQLERLRADLLGGQVSPDRLQRIVGLIQRARTQEDPALAEVMGEIELRARVELAKLGIKS
jgi:hypothetical protein